MAARKVVDLKVTHRIEPEVGGPLDRILAGEPLQAGDVRGAVAEIWSAVVEIERRQPRAGRQAEPEATP